MITWSGGFPASACVEIGEAADLHARDSVLHAALAGLRASAALGVAPARPAFR